MRKILGKGVPKLLPSADRFHCLLWKSKKINWKTMRANKSSVTWLEYDRPTKKLNSLSYNSTVIVKWKEKKDTISKSNKNYTHKTI